MVHISFFFLSFFVIAAASPHIWVHAADVLVRMGARWDSHWRTSSGASQLHLLLAAFPPAKDDGKIYR